MATTKFSEADREKLFAQLEVPFDPAQVKWRVMRTSSDGRTGLLFPFADPRAYTDRLNQLFTPAGWSCEYSISTVPSLTRVDRGKVIVTSKILVASAVTINRLGSHAGTGEAWADRDNAATTASAQAFKRACACFGLGRYLYSFGETWVQLNQRGEPVALPVLPAWALPPGVTVQPISGPAVDVRGPVDPKLTVEIEGFRSTLGVDIYAGDLTAGGSQQGCPDDSECRPAKELSLSGCRQRRVDLSGFMGLVEMAGDARFVAAMDSLKFCHDHVPSQSGGIEATGRGTRIHHRPEGCVASQIAWRASWDRSAFFVQSVTSSASRSTKPSTARVARASRIQLVVAAASVATSRFGRWPNSYRSHREARLTGAASATRMAPVMRLKLVRAA